jgi:methyl-accepting chemotaxis protein
MINSPLLDSSSIKKSLQELADKVERSGDRDAGERLRMLSEAVDKSANAPGAWKTASIYQMIDPDSIVEGYRTRHISAPGCLVEAMEVLRNTFIFAPIIVTWYGVSQATSAYSRLLSSTLKTNPDQVSQPFLYLWQQGFGGRLPAWLTLSSIALIDAVILAIILLLTLLVSTLSNASRQQQERRAQELHADLVHAIAGATLCLQNRQQASTAGGNLQQVAQNIEDMANDIRKSFDKLGKDMLAQYDTTVNAIAGKLKTIADDMIAQVQKGDQYLQKLTSGAAAVDRLAQNINDSARRLEDANKELRDSLDKLLKPASDLANQQKSLLDAVKQSISELQTNANLLKTNANELSSFSKQQKSSGEDFTDAVDTLNSATSKIEDMVTKLGGFASQQTTFLDQLADERDAQTKLAENMTRATLGMEDALKAVHALTSDMRRIAVDTNDLMRLYAALPATVRTDMANIVNGYIGAAHVLSKGGSDLSDAATSIFTAGQELERVITELEKRLAKI